MDLALYDSTIGYYARASRRSGRAGDFFTSVDVGRVFGELLSRQIAEMADLLKAQGSRLKAQDSRPLLKAQVPSSSFDLVEAGAGDGRLAADVLRGLARARADLCKG